MINIFNVYFKLIYVDDDFTYRNEKLSFSFESLAEYEQMTNDMNQIFPVVENVLLYAFDKINDVDSCLKNHEYFNIPMFIYEDDDFGAKWSGYTENEGLLYIKADNRQAITESRFREIKYIEKMIAAGKHPPIVSYERFKQNIEDGYERQLNAFDRIRDSKELYARALNELEKRAVNNKELLRLSTRIP